MSGRGGATPYSGPEDEKTVEGQDLTVWCKQRWQYENPLWSGSGWKVNIVMLVFSVMRERGSLKIYYNYRRREEAPIQVSKCSWTHASLSRWKKGIVTPWDRQIN